MFPLFKRKYLNAFDKKKKLIDSQTKMVKYMNSIFFT